MGVKAFLNKQQLPNIIQPVPADYSNSFKLCVDPYMTAYP